MKILNIDQIYIIPSIIVLIALILYTPLYRNLMKSPMLPNYSLRNFSFTQSTKFYASRETFPKEQAFVIDIIGGVIVKEYVPAVLLLTISSLNIIRFFSRISNDRICIYLDSKTTTRTFLLYKFSSHKILFINNITPQSLQNRKELFYQMTDLRSRI